LKGKWLDDATRSIKSIKQKYFVFVFFIVVDVLRTHIVAGFFNIHTTVGFAPMIGANISHVKRNRTTVVETDKHVDFYSL
jgi:ABC-type tungstate transport system substrate-binding protein